MKKFPTCAGGVNAVGSSRCRERMVPLDSSKTSTSVRVTARTEGSPPGDARITSSISPVEDPTGDCQTEAPFARFMRVSRLLESCR